MTMFEFFVPLIALGVTFAGILILRHEDRKWDRPARQQQMPPAE